MSVLALKNRVGKDNWNTIQTFLTRIVAFGIGLLFKIVLARHLTVEENGVFGKWLASYNYGIIAFSLGLNLSMIYYSTDKSNVLYNFLSNLIVYSGLMVGCMLIALFLPNELYYFTLILTIFLGLILSSLNSVQLIANKISVFNMTEVSKNVLILLICLFPLYIFDTTSVEILYVLYPSALGITFIIFLFQLDFTQLKLDQICLPKIEYIKYGLKGTVLNVLSQSVYIIDVFLVSLIAGDRYLGLYVVASSIARLLWFFVDAAGTVIFPKLVQTSDNTDSKNLIYGLSSFSFLVSVGGLFIFYMVGENLVSLTFGEEYNEGFSTIIILMIASPGMIFYKLINRYLASKNEWNRSYVAVGIALIVNIILNLLLISRFNILGAAYASLISYWLCGFLIATGSKFTFYKLMFSFQMKNR